MGAQISEDYRGKSLTMAEASQLEGTRSTGVVCILKDMLVAYLLKFRIFLRSRLRAKACLILLFSPGFK